MIIKLQYVSLNMMMKIRNILMYLLAAILLTSCGGFSKIEIGEVKEINIGGFKDNALLLTVKLPIDNPSAYKITVLELDSKVYINKQYLGTVNSIEKVILPARSNDVYNLDLSIRVANFFGAALSVMNMKAGQKISVRMDGSVKARSLLLTKKIPFEESQEIVL